ncbi:unnamed protein product, partial [Medioppia subpectinata]
MIKVQAADNDVLPAVPLVVKSPYLSTWMTGRQLAGEWTRFWTGGINGMGGMVRVDGQTYEFMGVPSADVSGGTHRVVQSGLK